MSNRSGNALRLTLGAVLLLALVCLCPPICRAGPEPAAVAPYCADLIRNGGFESGTFMNWSTSGAPTVVSTGGHSGGHSAQLGGRDNAVDRVWQVVSCPFTSGRITCRRRSVWMM